MLDEHLVTSHPSRLWIEVRCKTVTTSAFTSGMLLVQKDLPAMNAVACAIACAVKHQHVQLILNSRQVVTRSYKFLEV